MAIFKSALVALFAIIAFAQAEEIREKKHAHPYTGGAGSLGYTGQGYGYQPYAGYGGGAGLGYGGLGYGSGWNTPSYTGAWAAPQAGYGYGATGYGSGYGGGYGGGYGATRGGYGGYPGSYGHGHHSGYLG